MWEFILYIVVGALIALIAPSYVPLQLPPVTRQLARGFGGFLFLYAFLSTSYFFVGQNETGHMHRIYGGDSLPQGTIIALKGEKGPQADTTPPGFHSSFLVNILNDVTMYPVIDIPTGKVGVLRAKTGSSLRSGQTLADPLHVFTEKSGKQVDLAKMISDARYFLENGGQQGPQTTVLAPGTYRLNMFLWDVEMADALNVPKGHVAVIKSNIHGAVDLGEASLKIGKPEKCDPIHVGDPKKLIAPLVPAGCVGIWSFSLQPGLHYINPLAYEATLVDTRQHAWLYAGGYTRREIKLEVDLEGRIVQKEVAVNITKPEIAADTAIDMKVEGWTMHQAVRALVQVTPDNAPFVVASVGGLAEVEDRVVTPGIQSLLRDIAGGFVRVPDPSDATKSILRPTHALDFIEHRQNIEDMLEPAIIAEAGKAGILMQEVRLLETDFPPELLVARKREQLADQLARAYREEKKAQTERIAVEAEKATADQQAVLVAARIDLQAASERAKADAERGKGRRDLLTAESDGQKAQMEVLGADRVMTLQIVDRMLTYFDKHPETAIAIVQNAGKLVPNTVVNGGAGGLEGAAAILKDAFPSVQTSAQK